MSESRNSWQKLYKQIPHERRDAIEAYVAGFIARNNKVPYNNNPHSPEPQGCNPLFRSWRQGWADSDEGIIAQSILDRDKGQP